MPALLADTGRVDHIEVVEVDTGEVVLFWDRPPQAASKLARALRADLSQLEAEEFIARWATVEQLMSGDCQRPRPRASGSRR